MYEVYMISNRINNKLYIGVTSIGLKERWYAHVSCSKHYEEYSNELYKDMNRFGVENFFIESLESDIPECSRDAREMFYIEKYNTKYPYGYNLTDGGFKNSGVLWPSDRGRKISQSQKGKHKSEQHRKNLSKSRLGKYIGPDNPFYGRHHTEECKRILSISNSKRSIEMLDSENCVINTFYNMNEAGRYVVNCGLSKADPLTCANRIREVCVQNCDNFKHKAYGYFWRFVKV